jgi:hypothetical protein
VSWTTGINGLLRGPTVSGAVTASTRRTLAVGIALLTLTSALTANDPVRNDGTNNAPRGRGERPADDGRRVLFGTEVVPVLTRLGCNGGGCHGKATGQNGFRLSLLGFEPDFDYESLVTESRGRRISLAAPEHSLLLLKATARVPHGGGRRLEETSDEYGILRGWIAQGALPPRPGDARPLRIEIEPAEQVFESHASTQLRVTVFLSDGSSREVTRQTMFQSNEPAIISVDTSGRVTVGDRRGVAAVMARFGEQIATFRATVPFAERAKDLAEAQAALDKLEPSIANTKINQMLIRQWRRLGIVPSPMVDDAAFLRRATIDICGTLPTAEELAAFLSDTRADKRVRLIDRLLERPEYASYFALKWADILRNRGSGYSTSQQRAGTALFASWIRDSFAANKRYDCFVTEILTASGRQNENPPTVWYRTVRKAPEFVESVAQAFLGVRVQCAQCHHHPTERWSTTDYFGLAAVFSQVGRKGGFADAEVPTDESIFVKDHGEVRDPRTGRTVRPRPLGGTELPLKSGDDPRESLARWMTRADNPFFARTMANRLWAHFLGRGIVHPIDDARDSNPPSNPELLDALSEDFVASGYDVKQLIRAIGTSHAYALQATPTESNAADSQSFARFYPRRLQAEVLMDALSQVLDVPTEFPGVVPGTRAIDLPDENVAAHFLDVFGRPARLSACECERTDAPSLAQALELVNSAEIQRKLAHPAGYAARLAASGQSLVELANQTFVRSLARPPRPEELQSAVAFLESETDRVEACRSLLWALLATNEFLFNH